MDTKAKAIVVLVCAAVMLTFMIIPGKTAYSPEWWNITWHHRVSLEINSTMYARTNWPVEVDINFTSLLAQSGLSGTMDNNSIRVIEYNTIGNVSAVIPSQFDRVYGYNESINALGTVVFMLNGTTSADINRSFYVYYDITENGAKSPASYSTSLAYTWDGEEVNVNSSIYEFYIDTNRSENTSGIYTVYHEGIAPVLEITASNVRTAEYTQYATDGSNLSFDLRGNASIEFGPIRITVTQYGNETEFGNVTNQTGEAKIIKKYYIYNMTGDQTSCAGGPCGTWIMIEHEFENIAGSNITRYSTGPGPVNIDYKRSFFDIGISDTKVNTTNPPYAFAMGDASSFAGVVSLEQIGTSNFLADINSYRLGINLSSINITSEGTIKQTSLVYFGDQLGSSQTHFEQTIVPRYRNPIVITQSNPESLWSSGLTSLDHGYYNRNETITLRINTTSDYDAYNLVSYVNATLDMGTAGAGDDQTVVLYDDGNHQDNQSGDKVFGTTFNITDTYLTGQWNATFRIYYTDGTYLNQSSEQFNVTDVFNVNMTMVDKYQLTDLQMNSSIYVQNYRNDTNISNTTGTLNITCWYNTTLDNATLITARNISNMGNGMYYYQFHAPGNTGHYNLNCTATGNNNTGRSLDTFDIEEAVTYVSINTTQPSYSSWSVTVADNETFNITVIINNTGNATAQLADLSLEVLAGWNFTPSTQSCGNVGIGNGCQKQFNVTIPNATVPGNYSLNATVVWFNPNTTVYNNLTLFNVTVFPNPVVNVSTTNITSQVAEGYEMNVANFTVYSIGNFNLSIITFNMTGFGQNFSFEFIPENVTNLLAGGSQAIQVNVTLLEGHPPGVYNGTINVSSLNDGFQLINISLTVPECTNITLNTTQPSYSASSVLLGYNESFNITVNITNTGNATARYVNTSLEVPAGWSYYPAVQSCGTINISAACGRQFNVSIPNATLPDNYRINITVEWYNPDSSENSTQTQFNVTVLSNPVINVSAHSLSLIVGDGAYNVTENFTISSIGNDNITFVMLNATVPENLTFNFTPMNISNLTTGANSQAYLNITVPLHYPAGTYNGTINVSHSAGYQIINISMEVPSNRSWSLSPTACAKAESPLFGTACTISVNNNGNTFINFTVTPSQANNTAINTTNFTLLRGEGMDINVTYNVTASGTGFYDATYLVNASENDSNPANATFTVSLIPFVEPIISLWISHDYVFQSNQTRISINVTDRSDTGVNYTTVNITTPDNQSFLFTPPKLSEIQNGSTKVAHYSFLYPNATINVSNNETINFTGNSSARGLYSISVFSADNSPDRANKTETSSFSVYANLMPSLDTVSSSYYQNSHGWIICNVTDFNGEAMPGVNTTITVMDSLNRVVYNNSYTTSGSGWVFPMPEFSIAADAVQGTYNLSATFSYRDSLVNYTTENMSVTSFEVTGVQMGGIEANIETNVMWYPDSNMTFVITIYDATTYTPMKPDSMDLVVYTGSPLFKNVYLQSNLSDIRMQLINFSNVTNSSVGPYYTLTYVMPSNTASGDYWARVDATYGDYSTTEWESFKVTRGGPYDVEVTPLEDEVYREDYFDFEINVINMGDVGQDVDIEYWVTSTDNDTWYYKNFTVYTPAAQNTTLTRSAYIYSNQPYGQHAIHVKVTYDSILSSITTSATFQVVQKPVVTPPEEAAPGAGAAAPTTPTVTPTANLSIIEYPAGISVVRGWEDIRHIKVKNTGEASIENVTLTLAGIPSPWYEIKPEMSSDLPPGNTTIFVVAFNIPINALTGEYMISFVATGDDVGDEKVSKLTIFKSQNELVEYELNKVKNEYSATVKETDLAEKYGKDVTEVRSILKEAKIHINKAETEFKAESYTEAINQINIARELIKRAQDELGRTEYQPEMITRGIPLWMIVAIIVGFVIVNIAIIIWRKKAYKKLDFREDLLKVRDIIKSVKKEPSVAAGKSPSREAEKRKLAKVLDLLESEMKEGLITEKTYQELKNRNIKKLKKLK